MKYDLGLMPEKPNRNLEIITFRQDETASLYIHKEKPEKPRGVLYLVSLQPIRIPRDINYSKVLLPITLLVMREFAEGFGWVHPHESIKEDLADFIMQGFKHFDSDAGDWLWMDLYVKEK